MARIRLGDSGYRVPEAPPQGRQAPMRAFVTADGVQELGATLTGVADRALAEEARRQRELEAEEKARSREADRVKSITAQAQAKNALADLYDDIERGLAEGRYEKDKVGDLFNEQAQKLVEQAVGGVSPEHQPLVRAALDDDVGRSQRGVRKLVDAKNRADIGAGISAYLEEMQRYAARGDAQRQEAISNVDTFVRSAGPQAGLDAVQVQKQIQGFKEHVTFTYLDNQVTQNQRNAKGLSALQQALASEQYAELDPAKRNFLEAKIQRNQQHLAQMGEIAERRRLNNLERMGNRLSWYVENGREIPPAEFDQFSRAAKGTPYEAVAQGIIAEQKAVSEIASLPPQQMIARVQEIESGYGKTPTREQILHVEKLKRYAQNSIKQLQASPLDYAVAREGAVVEPLDLARPDSWMDNLAARSQILSEQSRRLGVEPKGLFPQEATALARVLSNATSEQKTEILGALRKGFADDRVFRASMQQIAPDSPVTALAAITATRERPMEVGRLFKDTFTPGSTAALALEGERLINPTRGDKAQDGRGKPMPMPKDADMRSAFNDVTEGVFAASPSAYDATYQYAQAIYAGLAARRGDYSGELNSSLWKESIQRATGGVANFNGAGNIQLPWGMAEHEFKDKAAQAFRAAVRQYGLPETVIDQFPRLGLQNLKGNQYLVKSGTGYLVGKNGQPVVIVVDEETGFTDARGRRLRDQIPK